MRISGTPWENTTHDWAASVDHEHLAQIREQPATAGSTRRTGCPQPTSSTARLSGSGCQSQYGFATRPTCSSPFAMTASFSTGSRTFTSDDLAVLDVRHMLFGEEEPPGLLTLGGSIRDFTTDLPSGPVTTSLYQALFGLLATEALLESGRAMRVNKAQVSSAGPDGRHVRLAWADHTNRGDSPTLVTVEGVMPSL